MLGREPWAKNSICTTAYKKLIQALFIVNSFWSLYRAHFQLKITDSVT